MKQRSNHTPSVLRVGIMADSHGRPQAIARALDFFEAQQCSRIYHLGDICDSFRPDTADACVDLLRRHRVVALKGNNDHSLVVNHQGSRGSVMKTETIDYLKHLPLVLHEQGAVIAHALPFVREQGLSCMIGTLGPGERSLFFGNYPNGMLIRGHQHFPEIVWRRHETLSQKIEPGSRIDLKDKIPCIVTVGALDNGFCMIWEPREQTIACHQTG